MDKRIGWSAGAIAFFVASTLAIFEVQSVMMPQMLFWGLVIVFIVGLVISIIVMATTVIYWIANRGKALEYVGDWYCHYNRQAREVSIAGAVNLWSSAITKLSGSITEENGTCHSLNLKPIHQVFPHRYALEFRGKDVRISSEKANIKVDIWLRNWYKKTLARELPVTLVGQDVSTPDKEDSRNE